MTTATETIKQTTKIAKGLPSLGMSMHDKLDENKYLGQPVYLRNKSEEYFYPSKCELIEKCKYISDNHFRYVNLYRSKNNRFFIVNCLFGDANEGSLPENANGKELDVDEVCMLGFDIRKVLDRLEEIKY